jgi:hypothetical protein
MGSNQGDLLPLPTNSFKFVICKGNGDFAIMDCPSGLVFNPYSLRCDFNLDPPAGKLMNLV